MMIAISNLHPLVFRCILKINMWCAFLETNLNAILSLKWKQTVNSKGLYLYHTYQWRIIDSSMYSWGGMVINQLLYIWHRYRRLFSRINEIHVTSKGFCSYSKSSFQLCIESISIFFQLNSICPISCTHSDINQNTSRRFNWFPLSEHFPVINWNLSQGVYLVENYIQTNCAMTPLPILHWISVLSICSEILNFKFNMVFTWSWHFNWTHFKMWLDIVSEH